MEQQAFPGTALCIPDEAPGGAIPVAEKGKEARVRRSRETPREMNEVIVTGQSKKVALTMEMPLERAAGGKEHSQPKPRVKLPSSRQVRPS